MNIPITNPQLNANLDSDESIKQEGVTINANNGSVINSNSANGRGEITRLFAMLTTILLSILGDALLGIWLYTSIQTMSDDIKQTRIESRVEQSKFQKQIDTNASALEQAIASYQENTKRLETQSKEGTIWLLRWDILSSIELFEAKKVITAKEYKRLAEEYNYYRSIGGNHDVCEKFEIFKTMVFGTKDIEMVK